MKTHSVTSAEQPHVRAGHEAGEQVRSLLLGINRRDEQIQESAALLLLMGNELARLAESGGNYSNEDGYGEFIATGLILVSHSAARKLHESTLP